MSIIRPRLQFLLFTTLAVLLALAPCTVKSNNELPSDIRRAIVKGNIASALPRLRKEAKRGNREAQFQLGMLFLNGNGVNQSITVARQWFTKAANKNHARSLYNLGLLYLGRQGHAKNEKQALDYFRKASRLGHSQSRRQLRLVTGGQGGGKWSKNDELLHAARKGDLDLLKRTIARGARLSSKDPDGNTALMIAARFNHPSIVRYLLTRNIKKSARNKIGDTAVHIAVNQKNYLSLTELLNNGAPKEMRDKSGNTPLLLATVRGDTRAAELLLKAGAKVDAKNREQQSSYALAGSKGDKTMQNLLKRYGASTRVVARRSAGRSDRAFLKQVRSKNQQFAGWSDLMIAARQGNASAVNKLIAAKKDLGFQERKSGKDALSVAMEFGNKDIARTIATAMLNSRRYQAALSRGMSAAAKFGDLEVFRLLTKGGVKSSRKVEESPMWIATENGRANILKFLIDVGAPMNIKNDKGTSLLILATVKGHSKLVTMLVKGNGDVDIDLQDQKGRTALWHSVDKGRLKITLQLLDAGAEEDIPDSLGQYPLTRGIITGNLPIVKLLAKDSLIDKYVTKSGNTPLMVAIEFGDKAMVRHMLGLGLNIEHRNNLTFTPLMLAVRKRKVEATRLLLSMGADPSRRSREGKTAADYAKGSRDLMRFF